MCCFGFYKRCLTATICCIYAAYTAPFYICLAVSGLIVYIYIISPGALAQLAARPNLHK